MHLRLPQPTSIRSLLTTVWTLSLLSSGCGAGAGDGSGGSASGGTGSTSNGSGGNAFCVLDCGGAAGIPEGCGDGALVDTEACDDGNNDSDDGCRADCSEQEVGYSCPTPGEACQKVAKCGDGITTYPEFCDDGATVAGDGCSIRCTFEQGYKCDGSPSTCTPTVCGDGVQEGAESCDDGNSDPYDGCNATCQAEPDCGIGACKSDCGDGLVISEECDDGNTRSGDGCSESCKVEEGFECAIASTTQTSLVVPVVYRDFRSHLDAYQGHPNFHWSGFNYVTSGIAATSLDEDGKPSYLGDGNLHVDSQTDFSSWYRDSERSIKYVEGLTLTAAVNKFTFSDTEFFPLDARGWAVDTAHPETLYDGAGGKHNFFFTSEVRYWVAYDPAKNATLKFLGDDDVWVFLAGKLVVDLGGVHDAVAGQVTLDATTKDVDGNSLNLVAGKVYEIAVFQAERNPGGSNYTLELSGFNANPSACTPVCGDGILALGEQCDDGENLGGYGKCAPGCVLTEYCGDGIKQASEYCDDGNGDNSDGCNNACRLIAVR